MKNYNPPNPYSFGDTKWMMQMIKDDKKEFKQEELKKELKDEKKDN